MNLTWLEAGAAACLIVGLLLIVFAAVWAYRRFGARKTELDRRLSSFWAEVASAKANERPMDEGAFIDITATYADLRVLRATTLSALLDDARQSAKGGPALLALLGIVLQTAGSVAPLMSG